MGKEATIVWIKKVLLKIIYLMVSLLIFCNAIIILYLHLNVPFFPVLFLFNFCFWFGYPIFLEHVLKKQWFECTKNDCLALQYILLPWLIMELIVLLYYHKITYFIIKTVIENSN